MLTPTPLGSARQLDRHDVSTPAKNAVVSLDQLPVGEYGRVVDVRGAPAARRRLLEMGFCTGVEVAAIRRAPLDDPIEFNLRGYFVSLRREQAREVVVAPVSR